MVTDTDLSVNLDGTTINIQRTYDSLTRDGSGDFGAGWTFVNLQTNLQTNLPTTGQEDFGVYNPFRDGTEVYLTLPTGQRVRFTFTPASFQVAGQTFYHPAWTADSGVTYTLQSTDTVLTKSGSRYYDLATGQPYNPGNPFFSGPSYTLTAPDGTQYQLNAQGNLVGEVTPTGAQLDISDSGITAANGQTIQFLRDAQGGISSILTPDGQLVTYQYDATGNLVAMENQTTGGSQRYGYDMADPHLLIAAVRSNGNSVAIEPGTTNTAYIQRDLGSAAQFAGTTITNPLAAGATDLLAFRFDQSELDSTATGSVLLRVQVQATGGSFVPAVPGIAGLQPRSVNTQGNLVVALYSIDQPGLYVVAIAGATAATAGNYSVNLTVAGDINGDGNVDGNDTAGFAAALGSVAGGTGYSLAADLNGDGKVDAAGRGDPGERLRLPRDHDRAGHAPRAARLRPRRQFRHAARRRRHDDAQHGDPGRPDRAERERHAPADRRRHDVEPQRPVRLLQRAAGRRRQRLHHHRHERGRRHQPVHQDHHPHPAGSQHDRPGHPAHLADDTGRSSLDNITSDDTVTGTITAANPIASFQAQVDQSQAVDVLASLSGTTFTITPAVLATINGGPLADGKHTLTLIAKDTNNNLVPAGERELHSDHDAAGTCDAAAPRLERHRGQQQRRHHAGHNADVRGGRPGGCDRPPLRGGNQIGQATANNGPVFITSTALTAGTHADHRDGRGRGRQRQRGGARRSWS